MYQKLNIPPIGIVENMSYYACPNCHHEADIFGHGGGETLAEKLDIPFLGRLPVYQPIREGSDTRRADRRERTRRRRPGARSCASAERTAAQVSILAHKAAEANKGKIPLIPGSLRARVDRNRASARQTHARQRPRRRRPRGSPCADRGGQPLVSRRIEERARRPHRVRAPVRAPDVRRVRAPQRRLLPAAAAGGRAAQRIHQQPIAPTTGRSCRRARWSSRSGWNRIAWGTCCRR